MKALANAEFYNHFKLDSDKHSFYFARITDYIIKYFCALKFFNPHVTYSKSIA